MPFWVDPQIAEREFSHLLIRVPNPLGDQIMATPALHSVRARYPEARITAQGTRVASLTYEGGGWFDEFLTVDRRKGLAHQVRELKRLNVDACLLLTGSLRTALVPFLARIPHRIGYRWSGRTPLLTASFRRPRTGGKKVPYPTKLYFNDLVGKLGCKPDGRPRLGVGADVAARAEQWLARQGVDENATLFPMCIASGFGPSKFWPAEHFATVADHMIERHGVTVVLLCGPGEEAVGERVRSHAKHKLVDSGLDPLDVDLMKALIRRAPVLLTNDTGPRHIAAAFRKPIVCMMGPTSPIYTETDNEETTILREEGIDCSPCHLKVCPIDHRCMTRITPDRAIAALEAVLGA